AMMVRRYEAYKDVVVRPFFHDHFARLDRQIVLVDALAAFNSGPEALHDLEAALAGILDCFRIGRSTIFSTLFRPRIDRILFAATKADHLHHLSHDRLEAVLRRAGSGAAAHAEATGATIDVVAVAAVRATREAMVSRGRDKLPSIVGAPVSGENANGVFFDGNVDVATFPGDLPADPETLFDGKGAFSGLASTPAENSDFRFLRFRPPLLEREGGSPPALPHIGLDGALQFLMGDRLQGASEQDIAGRGLSGSPILAWSWGMRTGAAGPRAALSRLRRKPSRRSCRSRFTPRRLPAECSA